MALNTPVLLMSSVDSTSESVRPSELTRRRLQSIAGTIDDDDFSKSDQLTIPLQQGDSEVEDELSEQQLRELYDSEEIDRFLNLFSAVSPCGHRLPHAS